MSDDNSRSRQPENNEIGGGEQRARVPAEEGSSRTDPRPLPPLRQYLEEDERSRLFMSEPSLTTEGDRTGDSPFFSYLLSPQNSSEDESIDEDDVFSPPPPSALQMPSVSSPGNTSLSSRDSPSFQNKVLMQFMQDKRSRLKIESTPYGPAILMTREAPVKQGLTTRVEELENKKEQTSVPSSRSTSSISLGQQLRAAEFLQQLKIQSVGALQDASPSDYDSVPAPEANRNEIGAVIRRHEPPTDERRGDDTIVMTLSDSDGENEDDKDSADDEQTFERPRRIRRVPTNGVGKTSSPGHRRSRSGDSAAAYLMTGGVNWKGMQDDIPQIPQSHNDDYEDEPGNCEKVPSPPRSSITGASQRIRGKIATRASPAMDDSTSNRSPVFAIGSPSTSMRKTRKPPRQRRWKSEAFDPRNFSPGAMRSFVMASGSPTPPAQSFASIGDVHARSIDQSHQHSFLPTEQNALNGRERLPSTGDNMPYRYMNPMLISFPFKGSSVNIEGDSFSSNSQRRNFGGRYNRQSSDSSGSLDNFQSPASRFSWISQERTARPASFSSSCERESMEDIFAQSVIGRVMAEVEDEGSHSLSDADIIKRSEANIDNENVKKKLRIHFEKSPSSLHDDIRLRSAESQTKNRAYRSLKESMLRSRNVQSQKREESRKGFFQTTDRDRSRYPTFICPKCGTLQRSFFTASTAPIQLEGPASYLALYFALYVVASLCIFGFEEGWKGLDCIYFAVITLTTAGLGDLVPTSDSAKIVCSIFIYFGVACIGLLLGTYLAGMLDESSYKEAMKSRADNCVVCSRVKTSLIRDQTRSVNSIPNRRDALLDKSNPIFSSEKLTRATDLHKHLAQSFTEQSPKRTKQWHDNVGLSESDFANGAPSCSPLFGQSLQRQGFTAPNSIPEFEVYQDGDGDLPSPISPSQDLGSFTIGSPMTTQILGRQRHTRHQSFDITNSSFYGTPTPFGKTRDNGGGLRSASLVPEQSLHESFARSSQYEWSDYRDRRENILRDDDSTMSVDSVLSLPASSSSRIKTAKYVLLTLKQALMNSVAIIFIGGIGFYYIEKMTMVDSFYFTTVLLTTVGYGDIAPVTDGGKLFATAYVLVAGTVLLNNMSLISMIPLELRRRRIEKAVLTQFGDELDDAALQELATGPLIHRLNLSARNANGLNECTREMFSLAMLVRLGKVTERDVRHTFAAFRRLDVDREGVLNSKTIISGKIKKVMSMKDLREGISESRDNVDSWQPNEFSDHSNTSNSGKFWSGHQESVHVEKTAANRRVSSMSSIEGEKAALLSHDVNSLPFVGGTFSTPGHDEEEGLVF